MQYIIKDEISNFNLEMSAWYKERAEDVFCKFVLFLINPLLGLMYALLRLKTKSSFIIIALFSLVFAISFTVPEGRTETFTLDSAEYRSRFEQYVGKSTQYYLWQLKDYISLEGKSDFYSDTINFVVSRSTNNYRVLFLVVAIVFIFFSLKSLKLFVLENNYKTSLSCLILLYLFLTSQIFNINAYRFYTALAITVYSVLSYFVKNDKAYLLILLVTPFFHGSFLVLLPLLIAYFLFGRYIKFWSVCAIVCFFISSISIELFNSVIPFLPSSLAEKYDGYVSAMYVYEINEGGSGNMWLKRLLELCCRSYFNIMLVVMILHYRDYIERSKCVQAFRFLLVVMSFANFTMMVPSLGSRFIMLALPFIAYIWLVCFSEKRFRKYIYMLGIMFVLLAPIPVQIMQLPCLMHYFKVLEPDFFLASPIYLVFKYLVFS